MFVFGVVRVRVEWGSVRVTKTNTKIARTFFLLIDYDITLHTPHL